MLLANIVNIVFVVNCQFAKLFQEKRYICLSVNQKEMRKPVLPINTPKVINAWCSYDIANSAYILSVNTVLYPIFYQQVTQKAFGSEMVQFLGMNIKNTVLYEYAIALGYFLVILMTLSLSGIADMGGLRKPFMRFFTMLGSFACIGLYWFTGANITLGLILPMLAVLGFAGSLVYYNSFLPIIATPDHHDRISAKGFSFGYAGSMLLLIFNIFSLQKYDLFGLLFITCVRSGSPFNGILPFLHEDFMKFSVYWPTSENIRQCIVFCFPFSFSVWVFKPSSLLPPFLEKLSWESPIQS
jgi:MFS-type transporter involved in bile tolerance (Atg22 family)